MQREGKGRRIISSNREGGRPAGPDTDVLAVIVIIIVIAALYLLAIRPNSGRQEGMRPFQEVCIAHRGLHTNPPVPENSLAAFRKAVDAGYGIELDVQLTTDDQLVVFHDETLERMCGDPRKLHELSYAELQQFRLMETEERIPLFRDVLKRIDGKVPLIVEIKSEGRYPRTTELTCAMLRDYPGLYCVESFHPMVLFQYARSNPETLRGQLSTDYRREDVRRPGWQRFLLTNLLLDFLSKPDFIAYDRQYPEQFSFRLCRRLYSPVCAAWTVKSREQLEKAKEVYSVFIFEGFDPNSNDHKEETA